MRTVVTHSTLLEPTSVAHTGSSWTFDRIRNMFRKRNLKCSAVRAWNGLVLCSTSRLRVAHSMTMPCQASLALPRAPNMIKAKAKVREEGPPKVNTKDDQTAEAIAVEMESAAFGIFCDDRKE